MRPVILLTGDPGIGKSTVIQKLVEKLDTRAGGFLTHEIRSDGLREGFEIVTLDGTKQLLATKRPLRAFCRAVLFGKYKVDLDAIDGVAVPALLAAKSAAEIVVVDEIGPMEALSSKFCEVILNLLEDRTLLVIGTIVARSHPFADRVKSYPRVKIISVTRENRSDLPDQLYACLISYLSAL